MSADREKLFRAVFWTGYSAMIIFSFIPVIGDLHSITLNIVSVKLHFDQLLHTLVYFLICSYYSAGIWLRISLFNKNSLRKFLAALLFLAVITELLQIMVPSRSFNPVDIAANIAGIGTGLIVIISVRKKRSAPCNQ